MLIIVTGASGSGKSEYAEMLACRLAAGRQKYYIATMRPEGSEAQARIRRHHKLRAGKGFETIECYQRVSTASVSGTVLLECISNLLANELFEKNGHPDEVAAECMKLYAHCEHLVIVTNEVFGDGCAYDEVTRDYIRRLGQVNVQLFERADCVVEVVYSIPVCWKGAQNGLV